jgi:hypothetical protein
VFAFDCALPNALFAKPTVRVYLVGDAVIAMNADLQTVLYSLSAIRAVDPISVEGADTDSGSAGIIFDWTLVGCDFNLSSYYCEGGIPQVCKIKSMVFQDFGSDTFTFCEKP